MNAIMRVTWLSLVIRVTWPNSISGAQNIKSLNKGGTSTTICIKIRFVLLFCEVEPHRVQPETYTAGTYKNPMHNHGLVKDPFSLLSMLYPRHIHFLYFPFECTF